MCSMLYQGGLIEQAGFHLVIWAGGYAISRSAALLDVGLLSFTEVVDCLSQIIEAVSLLVMLMQTLAMAMNWQ